MYYKTDRDQDDLNAAYQAGFYPGGDDEAYIEGKLLLHNSSGIWQPAPVDRVSVLSSLIRQGYEILEMNRRKMRDLFDVHKCRQS